MAFCPNCGAQIQGNAAFCASCGKSTAVAATPGGAAAGTAPAPATSPAPAANTGMADNVAGLLAYLLIPAILFLVIEPYNKNKFVRFHSFQCLFFAAAWFVLWIALTVVAMVPVVGTMLIFLYPIVGLAGLVLVVFLMVKAYQGQLFKLPAIGDMAEKQANAA
jgi:uncharacterized membrane protein